jgi:hypothetical protein
LFAATFNFPCFHVFFCACSCMSTLRNVQTSNAANNFYIHFWVYLFRFSSGLWSYFYLCDVSSQENICWHFLLFNFSVIQWLSPWMKYKFQLRNLLAISV